jgi:nucleotide-binding universal stress UspA family protein
MIEIARILCPVDFSETSRRALRYAAATARWYGSSLTVLHVVPYVIPVDALPVLAPLPAARLEMHDEQRAAMKEQAWKFIDDAVGQGVTTELEIVDSPQVYREITDQAVGRSADLIVLGTHGRSGYERLLLGSTAEKVLRTATVPVMVVPPAGEAVPAGDVRFHSILCGVDFSDCSLSALTYAMSFAQEADARLTLMTALEPVPEPAELWDSSGVAVAQARAADRAAVLARLRRLVPDSVRVYCHVETLVEEGKPYRELLRTASVRHADLIVIGSHSHGAVHRTFFGSTAGHVVRDARCPVLAVPPR